MRIRTMVIAAVLVALSVAVMSVASEDTSGDPAWDFEYDGMYYRFSDDGVFLAGTVDSEGTMEIPEYVVHNNVRYPVTGIGTIAFSGYTFHGDVVVPDWIRTMEYGAFWNSSIETISLPADVARGPGGEPFVWCESLTKIIVTPGASGEVAGGFGSLLGLNDQPIEVIEISEGVTSIGREAFQNFRSLETVLFPESLKVIDNNAFSNCSSLRTMSFPETLETIGNQTFTHCKSLTSVTIPNGIGEVDSFAFNDCTGLVSVTMPVDLTWLSAFEGCVSVERVTLTPGKTGIGKELKLSGEGMPWCESEKDEIIVTLEYGITSLGDSFFRNGAPGFKSLTFPDSLESAGSGVFMGCTGLESLTLGSKTEIDWTNMPVSLAKINVPGSNPYYAVGEYGIVFDKDMKTILYCPRTVSGEVVIPDGTERVNYRAFVDCNGITSLVIPDGVYLESHSFSSTNITSITCGIGVKSPGYPFGNLLYDEYGLSTNDLSGKTFVGNSERMYALTKDAAITSMEGPTGVSALVGTPFSELGLPGFLKANLSNGGTINVNVTWSDAGYDPTRAGFQEIRGTAVPPTGFEFGPGVSDEVRIIVTLNEQEPGTVFVTFMHEGDVFKTMEFKVGDPIEVPDEVPSKPSDTKYDYEFERWIGYYSGMLAETPVTFESDFREVLRTYTIVFKSEGEVLSEVDMQYGDSIVPPNDPVRDSDERFDYEFSGWAGYIEGMTVDGNRTFEATFSSTPVMYQVVFETAGAPSGISVPGTFEASYGSRVTIPTGGMDAEGYVYSVFVDGSKVSIMSFLMPAHDVTVSYRYTSEQEDVPVLDYEAESNSSGNLSIPADVVDGLRESGGNANLKFPCGYIVIPGTVLDHMQVGSDDVSVSMRPAYDSDLNEEQIEASGDNAVYVVSMISGGFGVSGLWSYITVALFVEDDDSSSDLYFLERDGSLAAIQSEYNPDTGTVQFSMDHLVPIMVSDGDNEPVIPEDPDVPVNPDVPGDPESPSEPTDEGGGIGTIGLVAAIAVMAVLAIAAVIMFRRRS